MTRAQALAIKAFGENFAGFWMIAREAGNRIGVAIDSFSDVKAHKFDVLLQVCIMRPKLGNHIDWACAAIKEVCGVSFTASEAATAGKYILNNWENLYNEVKSKLEED